MLSTLTRLKLLVGVPQSDTSQDALLTQILSAADSAVKAYTKRSLERAVITEYPVNGLGAVDLCLREYPVQCYSLSGTLTSGGTTVTGISSTANLLAGMPAVHASIPVGTTISTIASSTSVTLSAAATASGSATITFGLAVWLDLGGYFGDASDAFGSTTHLTLGSDFALLRDSADGSSKSGILRRIGAGSAGSALGWWPGDFRKGTLTARATPGWPNAPGCLKAVYTAGFAHIPDDLAQATDQLAAWLWSNGPRGGLMIGSENYEGYGYSIVSLRTEPELGSTRQLLTKYRRTAV